MMKANVTVTLKQGVLDTQGQAVKNALDSLEGSGVVSNVRIGKFIELDMNESDKKKAQVILERMCKKLLANPVIEDYHIEIDKIE
jgi:phosphoribosylformylglycinamidine synthase